MPIKLKLYNTQTRKKEEFSPVTPGKATLYVCGVTPYDYSHIGHGRSYVNFDVLVRTLKFLGLATTYIRNLTDIDDKLLKKAAAAGNIESYLQITQVYIDDYHEQMQKLGNLAPDVEPRATQSIDSMIKIIKTLLEKGHAYHLDSDIYFDVSTFPKYGKLSGKNIDDLLEGSRVEIRTGKKNPGDFALWKGNTDGKFWKTPWGHGRPGWHIECSAMIHDQSNTSIDIHGGGADLIFPHHENEIAQSEAAFGYPLANIWVHNALLNLDKAKMSKSVGNTLSLNKVLQTVEPMTLRYYFLLHSYQTPIEFGKVGLKAAEKGLNKLRKILAGSETTKDLTLEDIDTQNKFVSSLVESLCDDLNTPKLLGLIFKNSDQIVSSPTICSQVASLVTNVLGISLKQNKQETAQKALLSSKEVQKLIAEREQARANKDWATADSLRDQLKTMGIEVLDKKL